MKTINILLILSFLLCSQGVIAQRTYLDSSFGVNGVATITSEVVCNNVLSDDAGNIFIVGYPVSSTKNWETISTCVVTKIRANGELDKTFGENGVARVEVGMPIKYSSDLLITIQSNGKVVVGGVNQGTPKKVYVVRFLADGQPDDSFGNNGLFVCDYGQEYLTGDTYSGFSITSLPDESILVGGTARVIKEGKAFPYRSIVKVRPDGTLDEDFLCSDVSDLSPYFDLPIYGFYKFLHLSDGHILCAVLVGNRSLFDWYPDPPRTKRYAYFKMDYDGNLDTSFGNNGVWIGDYTSSDGNTTIAFEQSDGKILTGPEPGIGYMRLNPDGTLDESYDGETTGSSSIMNESGELSTLFWDENKYLDLKVSHLNNKGALQYAISIPAPIDPLYHFRLMDETALYTVGIDKDASTEDSNDIRIAKLLIDPSTTGIPNVKADTKLLILQKNGALLVTSETAIQNAELITMSGRVISKQNAGGQMNVSIPTTGLNAGAYLVRIETVSGTPEVRKVVIN